MRPIILLCLSALLACGDSTVPSGPGEPPDPVTPGIVALQIDPFVEQLPIGFQASLGATGLREDGKRIPVQPEWTSDQPQMVVIGELGTQRLARAIGGDGVVTITARFAGHEASIQTRVRPIAGRLAVVTRDQDGNQRLELLRFDGVGSVILDEGRVDFPSWSSDGQHLAYTCEHSVRKVCLANRWSTTGRPFVDFPSNAWGGPSWSADGSAVLFPVTGQLWSMSLGDSSARVISIPPPPGRSPFVLGPARMAPDGVTIVFETYSYTHDEELCVVRIGAPDVGCVSYAYSAAWSPDGSGLAAVFGDGSADNLVVYSPDLLSFRIVRRVRNSSPSSPTWSPDGQWIAFTRRDWVGNRIEPMGVWAIRPDGSNLVQLAHGVTDDRNVLIIDVTGNRSPAWGR